MAVVRGVGGHYKNEKRWGYCSGTCDATRYFAELSGPTVARISRAGSASGVSSSSPSGSWFGIGGSPRQCPIANWMRPLHTFKKDGQKGDGGEIGRREEGGREGGREGASEEGRERGRQGEREGGREGEGERDNRISENLPVEKN